MIIVTQIEDVITVSLNEKEASVKYSKKAMESLLAIADTAEAAESMKDIYLLWNEVVTLCNVPEEEYITSDVGDLWKNTKTGHFHLKHNGLISHIPLPLAFVLRIQRSLDKDISIEPLMKCWLRFLRNPRIEDTLFRERFFNYIDQEYLHPVKRKEYLKAGYSQGVAEDMSYVKQVKITNEGLIAGFKVSQEVDWKFESDDKGNPVKVDRYHRTFDANTGEITGDSRDKVPAENRLYLPASQGDRGDAFYCGDELGHFIRIGKTHKLESWDQVNCNDNAHCVKGLHMGNLTYISGYAGEIHNVYVDPMFIGAIPTNQEGVLRVKEYFVHSTLKAINDGIYHSSKYAAENDEEWEAIKQEHFDSCDKGNEAQLEYNKHLKNI